MSKPHIFFISGLGADHRAFERLNLDGYQQTHLPWIEPTWKDDLHSYARKLAEPVMKAENPVVIGLSLGGMIASEMTTFIPHVKVILISSIKSPEERSMLLRAGRSFPIQRLVPPFAMQRMSFIWGFARRRYLKDEVDHMIQMFNDQNDKFLRWAIVHAPKWKGKGDETRIAHIHGTADRMFPIHRINNPIKVHGGTHFMVFTRADEITELVLQELNRLCGVH